MFLIYGDGEFHVVIAYGLFIMECIVLGSPHLQVFNLLKGQIAIKANS